MDGFWSVFWQAIINKTVWAWFIGCFTSGAIGLVLDFTLWRRPKWENKLKWLRAAPFIIFGILLLISLSIAMPYNIWQNDQAQLLVEKKKSENTITNMQSQIDELQQQITDLKAKIPLPLTIISNNSTPPEVYSTNPQVTITVRAKPPYSHVIPQTIQNDNEKYYIYEIIKFQTSEGFKILRNRYQLRGTRIFSYTAWL